MLLNTEINVVVTNNGTNNEVSVNADVNLRFNDVLTSLELAKQNYITLFKVFLTSKYPKKPTEKQVENIIQTVTLEDIFTYSKNKSK